MTTPEGQPRGGRGNDAAGNGTSPPRSSGSRSVPEQSPLTPVFDEATRQRTAEIIARYPQSRSALLPLLHLVQSVEGFVSQDGIRFCAEALELTTAEVSAVVTFYTMYKRTPCGEHLVSVCTNTLCAALGGDDIYRTLSQHGSGSGHEETAGEPGTPGSITLEHAECLAACDLAPVLQVNYEFFDNQTVESAAGAGRRRCGAASARSRRAARRSPTSRPSSWSWPASSRTSPEPSPGTPTAPETLRGAQLAADRGWVAPAMPDTPPALPDLPEKKMTAPITDPITPVLTRRWLSPRAWDDRRRTSSWTATPALRTRSPRRPGRADPAGQGRRACAGAAARASRRA